MPRPTPLEIDFENTLREAAQICIRQYKYRPTYFLSMLGERGGVATAKALLSKSAPSSGFSKIIMDFNRPDLTMEHYVSELRFQMLFSDAEIAKAKRWLGRK
jgi:hypothetical protein